MATYRAEMALDPALVDALIGSPYFHAGLRAFADPDAAHVYRVAPRPSLRLGDVVR